MPMPAAAETSPEASRGLLVCAIGHTSKAGTYVRGERVRHDNPAVAAAPDYFVTSDTPESEWPTEFDRAIADNAAYHEAAAAEREARFQAAAKANRVELTVASPMRCVRDFTAYHGGAPATIVKGSRAPADDPLVVAHPEHWKA